MKVIKSLTKEQERQIPKFIDRFVKLAEKPTDRKAATKAVQNLYKSAGQEKPIVIFAESPFAAAIMVAICREMSKGKLAVEDSQLDSQLRSQLRSQLDSQLYSQLDSQLYLQLYSQLDSQLYLQLPKINNDWWLLIWWLVWAGWYAFAEYIGVKFDNKTLKLFMDFVTNVSFIIPYKGIAFVSETPKRISWNNKLLHGEHEAAVEYKDGYSLYAYNGVRVPEKVIKNPEKLTIKDWQNETSLEVKRIIQERMGGDFAKKLKAKLISKPSKEFKKHNLKGLYEVELPNDPERIARYIKVRDHSSDREYFIRVKPTIDDADTALAWTFGMEKDKYTPFQEA